jgi:hypothetical protein
MNCLSCKKPITANAKFCNFCGGNQAEIKSEVDRKAEEKSLANMALMGKVRKYGLIGLAGLAIIGGAMFAYNKSLGENLVDMKAAPVTNSASRTLVMNEIKRIYKNYVPANDCYINDYVFNGQRELYCLKLSDVYDSKENGGDYIYIILSGINVDENFQPNDAHVSSGSLEFVKLKNESGKLKVVADSAGIPSGSYGRPGTAKILPVGKDNIGWMVLDGYGGMGEYSTYISFFSVVKNKLIRVLSVTPKYDSKDACNQDDKSCAFKTIDLAVRQDKNQEQFYPIKLSGSVTSGTLAQSSKISKDYVLTYNQTKGEYKVPADLAQFMGE